MKPLRFTDCAAFRLPYVSAQESAKSGYLEARFAQYRELQRADKGEQEQLSAHPQRSAAPESEETMKFCRDCAHIDLNMRPEPGLYSRCKASRRACDMVSGAMTIRYCNIERNSARPDACGSEGANWEPSEQYKAEQRVKAAEEARRAKSEEGA